MLPSDWIDAEKQPPTDDGIYLCYLPQLRLMVEPMFWLKGEWLIDTPTGMVNLHEYHKTYGRLSVTHFMPIVKPAPA